MTQDERERISKITNAELRIMERHGLIELSEKYRKEIEKEFKNRLIESIRNDKDIARDLLFKKPQYSYQGEENSPTDYFLKQIHDVDFTDIFNDVKKELLESVVRHKDDIVKNVLKSIFYDGLTKSLFENNSFRNKIRQLIEND